MSKRKTKTINPIVSVMHTGTGVVESFYSGEHFWREVWKYPAKLNTLVSKLEITFGHKFFHWCNVNNNRVWITKACGTNIADWDSWDKLFGEIEFDEKGKRMMVIHVTNAKPRR